MASSITDSLVLWQRWLTDDRLTKWNKLRRDKGLKEESRNELAQMMLAATVEDREMIKGWIGEGYDV